MAINENEVKLSQKAKKLLGKSEQEKLKHLFYLIALLDKPTSKYSALYNQLLSVLTGLL